MKLKILSAAIVPFLLTACGGSDSESNSSNSPVTTSSATESLNQEITGVYEGMFSVDGELIDFAGLVSAEGKVVFLTDIGEMLFGDVSINEQTILIDPVKSYYTAGQGTSFSVVGLFRENGKVTATYDEGELNGSSDFSTGTSHFTLVKSTMDTEQSADLEILTGNYVSGDYSTALSIDADGVISGSDDDGCVYNGIVTTSKLGNIYPLAIEVSNCSFADGSYEGLGTLLSNGEEGLSQEPVFLFGMHSPKIAVSAFMIQR